MLVNNACDASPQERSDSKIRFAFNFTLIKLKFLLLLILLIKLVNKQY